MEIDLLSAVTLAANGECVAPLTAKAVRSKAEDGTTLFLASTEREDRHMDVVRQDWRLGAFKANPVILDNHDYRRIVGVATDAWVPKVTTDEIDEGMVGNLVIRVKWDLDNPDPMCADVGRQHIAGFRRAGSVGFAPGKKTERSKLASDSPYYREPIEVESWWGGTVKVSGYLYERCELREFSSATIPANPDAVQRAVTGQAPVARGLAQLADGDVERWLSALDPAARARVVKGLLGAADAETLDELIAQVATRKTFLDLLERSLQPSFDRLLRAAGPTVRGLVEAVPVTTTPGFFQTIAARLKESA